MLGTVDSRERRWFSSQVVETQLPDTKEYREAKYKMNRNIFGRFWDWLHTDLEQDEYVSVCLYMYTVVFNLNFLQSKFRVIVLHGTCVKKFPFFVQYVDIEHSNMLLHWCLHYCCYWFPLFTCWQIGNIFRLTNFHTTNFHLL